MLDARLVLQSPASWRLFENYIFSTSRMMSTQAADRNGFITTLLPAAKRDEMTMHAILALSGAQLNYQNEAAVEIQQSAARHYRLTLRGLRDAVGNVSACTTGAEWLRLSLVLTVLCLIEVLSGQPDGSIFLHLRALRHFVLKIPPPTSSAQGDLQSQSQRIFVLEAYAYYIIASNIVPYGLMSERYVPYDSFMTDLGYIKEAESSGTFFCCGYSLFELIAPTASLAAQIVEHQEQNSDHLKTKVLAGYSCLVDRVLLAQYPFGGHVDAVNNTAQRRAGELYRTALLIWLKIAIWELHPEGESLLAQTQEHVDLSLGLLESVLVSSYGTIALWALVVIGSCLTRQADIDRLRKILSRATKWRLTVVQTVLRLLDSLHADSKGEIAGPRGLMRVMQDQGINLCMA
ncbi:hypothetical protein M409DRAFT_22578 [Zasmidium cellare ATCC 36951]|uniref:Transcription factor domain-containing protein n=1 Tax=Zasmidium cellare ATCC 36951 TaxID=1080233 RepID=A0A6A6CLR2_ZASCE|nr:uncharacterized protein M409DRAFT_22578 [Zasmidium cellare ATCC 36951]KAF2167148.1 hypothetical protein M409DRAFT_22578 [Zasmidium cellare ATCC 36951]